MAKYVVVRGDQTAITDAVTAEGAGVAAGAGIAPLDPPGPDVVEIVSFDDTHEGQAHLFSINVPTWYGTVYNELAHAEKNAVARTEGH